MLRRLLFFSLFALPTVLAAFPAYGAVCGNNLIEGTEQCDDGNVTNGDGCSSTCTRESLPPITGNDVIENFTTPRTFTDGQAFGACNALTVETSGSPSLSIVNNSYLLATVPAIPDAFIIRTTNPLPSTYKVTVDIGDIEFDLINLNDFENGFYLPTITAVPGSPTINDWWHLNRKVHIDIDNNFWGWGGSHPVFVGYYDPSSLTAPDPSYGQLVYDQATNSWVEINTNWASIFNYQKNTWYTFEIEKTTSTYFFRIFNAFTHVKLREASIPISSVRSGADYLAIGDPHTNYYNGNAKIANLRITNISCGSTSAPIITAQPQNANVFVGQNAAFSVTATGTPSPTYQWQSKASGAPSFANITGATASSFTLANAQLSNSGTQLRVVVTNSSGTVTSNAATLTVTVAPVAPSISAQPQNASVFVGQSAAFSVTATGTPAPTYQWQSKASGVASFANIAGATASSYTFTNSQLSDSGTQLRVVVTNSSGTVTSNPATLTVTLAPVAPSIMTHPQSASVFVGQNAAFSITATGAPAPTYQWQSQTLSTATFINITGATSSSYTFTNAQLSDNGTQFRVVITNSSGTVISNAALLTVNTLPAAPTITLQPSDASIAVGQSAIFRITATGSPAPTYQWQSKAINAISFSNIVGATSSTYTLVNAQLSANGTQLRCIVANTTGTVISRTVYLVVRQAPLITTQPKSTSTLVGQSAAFNITATGNPIPTYQWQSKAPGATSFTNIVGATSSAYIWVNVQLSHSGTQLRCIASNNTGTTISNAATLTVIQVAPLITAQPQSINVFVNQNAAFSIMATGIPAPTYQWQSHVSSTTTFTNIAGATSSDYIFTNAQLSDNGTQFRLVVSNSTGTVTSNTATLTVTLAPVAPAITTQPESASVFVGQDAAFSVAATGTPAPVYQWQLKASNAPDFTDISGATASSYTFTNALLSNNATQLRVVVTNSSGTVTSNVATLIVSLATVAPLINAQPLNASIYVGQSATFSVTATGTPAPTYQWQSKASGALNFIDISGATASSYTFTNAQLSNNTTQLRVVATNSSGTVTSNVATLTVTASPKLPVITGFWQRNPVYVGQIAAFSVTSTGTPTPTYQWQSKIPGAASFTNIAGATNFNILWPNAKLSDNGTQLRVQATNSSGTATSMVATLIVNAYAPPVISTQPLDKFVILGQNALFRVTATGSPAPTYQWQSQTPSTATFTNIAGATSSSYTFTNAQLSDNGTQFRVVVKNSTGTVISNVATLTVTASTLPVISAQPQNKTVIVGQGALFSVSATGSPAPTYQWQSQFFSTASFANIPGATAASYTFANAQLSHNNAQFRILVTNSSGTVISNAATLTVTTSFAPASLTLVAPDFSNVRVFPNPWRADRHTGKIITFDNLTSDSIVRIFTVSGYLVKTLPSTNGSVIWDLTTSGGDRAASGLYIYLITAGDRNTRGKLAIIK